MRGANRQGEAVGRELADREASKSDSGHVLLDSDRPSSPPIHHSPDPISLVRETLRRGILVDDGIFDSVYPSWIRRLSRTHWTPVEVAVRAASLLAPGPRARVLDVGSGVGKFCVVAAACGDARVHGVEHRPHLVDVARAASARLGVDATFTYGTLADIDAQKVDGIYLFNPFEENLSSPEDWIDGRIDLGLARYRQDVIKTIDFLRATRIGTRVVTYCGFGGHFPPEFTLARREYRAGRLELWTKTSECSGLSESASLDTDQVKRCRTA